MSPDPGAAAACDTHDPYEDDPGPLAREREDGGIPHRLWPPLEELAGLKGEERVTALAREVYVLADCLDQLIKLTSHMADRVAHLECRLDESGIPFRPDLMPESGTDFRLMYGMTP